jgi:MoaA/NifB/PqqE/SkfB family radical SAM enzyme
MCNIWKKYHEYPNKYKEELTIEEIRVLFSKSILLRQLQAIGIAGGEPFLKRDFVEIVLFLYEINPSLKILIPSNGQKSKLIEERLRCIRHTLVKNDNKGSYIVVGFSLDGIGETHDKIRGAKGSCQRVLESIELIRKIEGIQVKLSFTFTPGNYKEFLSVYELSKQLDVDCGFQFAQVSNHYYDNEEKQFKWNKEQLAEIREILIQTGHLVGRPYSES